MILECKSCEKKFVVPDNAIPISGRLVQCSSCGNKWTQFPINKIAEKKTKTIIPKKIVENKFKAPLKKKKVNKKKIGPTIYSREYLESKHGIKIDGEKLKAKKKGAAKSDVNSSYFGFYSYLLTMFIVIALLFGLLNLTKEIITSNFPFLGPYIDILYENINNFKILLRDAFNLY